MIKSIIELLAKVYKYRPLPKYIRNAVYSLYHADLNGFENPRLCTIDGVLVSAVYTDVVIGDYGAYVEIHPNDIRVKTTVPYSEVWRCDKQYLEANNLSIKYIWLEFHERKVYHQVATVKYANYKPGYYYISVFDFDEL